MAAGAVRYTAEFDKLPAEPTKSQAGGPAVAAARPDQQ